MANVENETPVEISNRAQWTILGVGLAILIGMFIYATIINSGISNEVAELEVKAIGLRNDLEVKRHAEQQVRNEVIYQTTGINPQTVQADTTLVQEFITPAFSWVDGEEYNEARSHYGDLLGENSSFVNVYLAPNIEIDGHSYIDVFELKSELVGVELFALDGVDNTMEYLAVVDFFMYKDSAELSDRNKLQKSTALINISVVGEGDERTVMSMDAKPGFNVNIEME